MHNTKIAIFNIYTLYISFILPVFILIAVLAPTVANAQTKLSDQQLHDLRIVTDKVTNYLPQSGDYIIKNVNVLVGNGEQYEAIDVHLKNGIIDDISYSLKPRGNTVVIEADGKWLTPGLIDFVEIPLDIDLQAGHIPYIVDYLSSKDKYFETALRSGVTGIHLIDATAKMQIGNTYYTVVDQNIYQQIIPTQKAVFHYRCDENKQRNDTQTIRDLLKTDYFSAISYGEMPFILHCDSSDRLSYNLDLLKKTKLPVAGIVGIESYKLAHTLDASICLFGSGLVTESQLDATRMSPLISFTRDNYQGCTIVHTKYIGNIPYLHAILGKISATAQLVRRIANQGGLNIANTINWVTSVPAKLLGFDKYSSQISIGKSGDVVLWTASPNNANALVDSVFIKSKLVFSDNKLLTTPDSLIGRTSKIN